MLEASRTLHFGRGLSARRYYLLYDSMSLLSPVEANQLGVSLDPGSATWTLVARSVVVELPLASIHVTCACCLFILQIRVG